MIVRVDAQLFFANTSYLRDRLHALIRERNDEVKLIVINANAINGMDSSAVHALDHLIEEYRSQGMDVYFTSVIGPVRDILRKSGLMEKIGQSNFFMNTDTAIQHYQDTGSASGGLSKSDPRATQSFGPRKSQ